MLYIQAKGKSFFRGLVFIVAVVSQLRVPTWPSCSARVQSVPTPGTHPPVSSLNLPNLFGQLIFSARQCPPSKNLFYQKVIVKYVFFFHRTRLTCPPKLNNRPKTMSPQSLVLSTTSATPEQLSFGPPVSSVSYLSYPFRLYLLFLLSLLALKPHLHHRMELNTAAIGAAYPCPISTGPMSMTPHVHAPSGH